MGVGAAEDAEPEGEGEARAMGRIAPQQGSVCGAGTPGWAHLLLEVSQAPALMIPCP